MFLERVPKVLATSNCKMLVCWGGQRGSCKRPNTCCGSAAKKLFWWKQYLYLLAMLMILKKKKKSSFWVQYLSIIIEAKTTGSPSTDKASAVRSELGFFGGGEGVPTVLVKPAAN